MTLSPCPKCWAKVFPCGLRQEQPACVYVCMYVCTYVCIFVRIAEGAACVCMHVCICIYECVWDKCSAVTRVACVCMYASIYDLSGFCVMHVYEYKKECNICMCAIMRVFFHVRMAA